MVTSRCLQMPGCKRNTVVFHRTFSWEPRLTQKSMVCILPGNDASYQGVRVYSCSCAGLFAWGKGSYRSVRTKDYGKNRSEPNLYLRHREAPFRRKTHRPSLPKKLFLGGNSCFRALSWFQIKLRKPKRRLFQMGGWRRTPTCLQQWIWKENQAISGRSLRRTLQNQFRGEAGEIIDGVEWTSAPEAGSGH